MRQRALELGFDDCRFTTAKPPASAPQFEQWLADERHGEMGYLQRNAFKRVEPQHVLEGARSVICLAASYAAGRESKVESRGPEAARVSPALDSRPSTLDLSGVVARYARFEDYHDVLGEQLKALNAFVDQLGGAGTRSLWYVDTGPLLERDLAQRAGLGFVGKHTHLISRRLGNWIFLSEIITTLALEPDAPERNRCGSCTRCIAACPTHAITAPFELDARLCISYLTIELKGSIPVELRPALGARIYGCDDCLAVCPWNKFAQEGRLMKQHAREDFQQPDLLGLLALDDAAFRALFAKTATKRTGRDRFVRNVLIAIGNSGDAALAVEAERERAADDFPSLQDSLKLRTTSRVSTVRPFFCLNKPIPLLSQKIQELLACRVCMTK
ncbi:MAG: tRNA epoxyqueuosine(34) reductase QueG [Verrucomicrobia bacterium]|nr:tRNA epoxyqueuosine(34) reductase QueG [Verrucomicrobiota bacterium]